MKVFLRFTTLLNFFQIGLFILTMTDQLIFKLFLENVLFGKSVRFHFPFFCTLIPILAFAFAFAFAVVPSPPSSLHPSLSCSALLCPFAHSISSFFKENFHFAVRLKSCILWFSSQGHSWCFSTKKTLGLQI